MQFELLAISVEYLHFFGFPAMEQPFGMRPNPKLEHIWNWNRKILIGLNIFTKRIYRYKIAEIQIPTDIELNVADTKTATKIESYW